MTEALHELTLDYYHCTFFLPLYGLDELFGLDKQGLAIKRKPYTWGSKAHDNQREDEYQALRFFSPVLRDILFDTGEGALEEADMKPLQEWRLSDDELLDACIELTAGDEDFCIARLEAVQMYRYFNGIHLLSFRVVPGDKEDPSLERWLRVTSHMRLLYPAFTEQEEEDKQSTQKLFMAGAHEHWAFHQGSRMRQLYPEAEVSQVVRGLLNCFLQDKDGINRYFEKYREIYDDRMFVSVAYGLKEKPADETLQRISYLAAFVDTVPDGDYGYVYHKETLSNLAEGISFDLWRHKGARYMFTDYANAYVYGGEPFFKNVIAPKHVIQLYDRMLVQALFYQASLRHYDLALSKDTDDILAKVNGDKAHQWRKEFISFTNQYWFHNLTEQMQGKAIFNLQQNALGLREHYGIIKDELERTDEFLQSEHETRMNRFSENISQWGLLAAFLALYYSLLPVLNDVFSIGDAEQKLSFWARASAGADFFGLQGQTIEAWGLFLLVFGPLALGVVGVMAWRFLKLALKR